MKMVSELVISVPVVSQAKGFYDIAKNLTNATDAEGAIIGGVKILI